MKVLLLSAGLGTRLRPITTMIPKCLVPINGKPLLEYWLDNLSAVGINEFIVNTHYFSEKVEEYINSSKYKENVSLIYEEELLLTAGTILNVKQYIEGDCFMVVHADNLSLCDFKAFIEAYNSRPNECEITMMTFRADIPESCGIVELDMYGVVQKFHEKVKYPPSNLANGAVYICAPSVLEFIESLDQKRVDFSNDVLPHFMGKINTFLNDKYHRDIGTVESYAIAQIEMFDLGENVKL